MNATLDQYRTQYARNLKGLREMLVKAEGMAPRKYRGYNVTQLAERVNLYQRLATYTDAELTAHLAPYQFLGIIG